MDLRIGYIIVEVYSWFSFNVWDIFSNWVQTQSDSKVFKRLLPWWFKFRAELVVWVHSSRRFEWLFWRSKLYRFFSYIPYREGVFGFFYIFSAVRAMKIVCCQAIANTDYRQQLPYVLNEKIEIPCDFAEEQYQQPNLTFQERLPTYLSYVFLIIQSNWFCSF